MEYAEEYRHVFQYKEIYKQRRETIERVFADAKERHGLRYTMLRGLEKVKMQATLTFACMNLKKLAIWKHRKRQPKPPVHGKNSFCEKIKYRLLYKAKIWQRVWITCCHICLQSVITFCIIMRIARNVSTIHSKRAEKPYNHYKFNAERSSTSRMLNMRILSDRSHVGWCGRHINLL